MAPSLPQLLGPYQLKARLAVGGQSEVWVALRRGPGGFQRRCAVKLLTMPVSLDEDARKAFFAEARLMAHFDHPNLVAVTDLGEDVEHRILYNVMPYVSGTSLARILREKKVQLAPPEALWVMGQVFLALDFAHRACDGSGRRLGIIHRDVSPENVMVGFDGGVRLIDFGIALSSINPRSTRAHVVKGKLDYLSPEQASASTNIDHTTDIYSAGLLLYTMLAGFNPIEGDPETALKRARAPKIPPINREVSLPAELTALIHALLKHDPTERPQRARDVARDLMAVIHKIEPAYDGICFEDRMRELLRDEIQAEEVFLESLAGGTQVMNREQLASGPPSTARPGRRHSKTPMLDANDIVPLDDRDRALERRRDNPPTEPIRSPAPAPAPARGKGDADLDEIFRELEDIYDDD